MRFADLADAGRRLAPMLADVDDPLVLAVEPRGVPVARAVAQIRGWVVTPLPVQRTDEGVAVHLPVDVAGRLVLVVDDGVETGTAARAVARALRDAGAARTVLAVPVCPREVEADLRRRYDEVIAVTRPMVRRSLRWHYETFA